MPSPSLPGADSFCAVLDHGLAELKVRILCEFHKQHATAIPGHFEDARLSSRIHQGPCDANSDQHLGFTKGPRVERLSHVRVHGETDDVDTIEMEPRLHELSDSHVCKHPEPEVPWTVSETSCEQPESAQIPVGSISHHMHSCWVAYVVMLRNNEADCKTDYSSARAKVESQRVRPHTAAASLLSMLKDPARFKGMIHPRSWKRTAWLTLTFFALLFDVVMLPVIASFELKGASYLNVVMMTVAVFWTFDIIANFRTGQYVHGVLEMRQAQIARIYAKAWLPFDLSLVILDWTVTVLEASSNENNEQSMVPAGAAIRSARAIRLIRLLRLSKMQTLLQEGLAINHKGMLVLAGLIKATIAFAIYCHFLACGWYGLGRFAKHGWVSSCEAHSMPVAHCYFSAAHWAFTQLHGTTDLEYVTTLEWAVATLFSFIGLVLISFFIGIATNVVTQLAGAERLEMRRLCAAYTKKYNLSSSLTHRVLKYIDVCNLEVDLGLVMHQEGKLLQILPMHLQADMLEEARRPLLSQVRIIYNLGAINPNTLRQLCSEAVSSRICLTGEFVFSSGDAGSFCRIAGIGSFIYRFGGSTDCPAMEKMPSVQTRQSHDEEVGQAVAGMQLRRNSRAGLHDVAMDAQVSGESIYSRIASGETRSVNAGNVISEMVLWTPWVHIGDLIATSDAVILQLSLEALYHAIHVRMDTCLFAATYAQQYVKHLNFLGEDITDLFVFTYAAEPANEHWSFPEEEPDHLIFLSHYKAEAGTEATLMREALQSLLAHEHPGHGDSMVFLDSEDLRDLTSLQQHVMSSRNLLLLLTPGVLLRPWCLVEIVTALDHGVQVVPVEIQRPGLDFRYPDDHFYASLRNGAALSSQNLELLTQQGIKLEDLERILRCVFMQIALPFSPQKSKAIRDAELADILKRCGYHGITQPREGSTNLSFPINSGSFRPTRTSSSDVSNALP